MAPDYLSSVKKQFEYYKLLGDKTFAQLPDDALFWQYNAESNSIAVIVQHLWGNMLSRWTDFLTSDGEKEWRNRDAEFEAGIQTRPELLTKWEAGWACLFTALASITEANRDTIVYIRNQGHTVTEALNRQLAHYPYHVGQIVFIGKMALDATWQSLSIPRGKSQGYNAEKFAQPKRKMHFTQEYLPASKPGPGADGARPGKAESGAEAPPVRILPYQPQYAADFKRLNVEWIEKDFVLEAADLKMLDHPEEYVLRPGGQILLAEYQGQIVGACALIRLNKDTLELAKMAVSSAVQGLGIGRRLAAAALDTARRMGAQRVYLESNTGLTAAINLYYQLGFRKMEPDHPSPYERVNIHMELLLAEA